jgi:hypothetical protein
MVIQSYVPPYFKDQSVLIILYTYTSLIAPNAFNYRRSFSPGFVVVSVLLIILVCWVLFDKVEVYGAIPLLSAKTLYYKDTALIYLTEYPRDIPEIQVTLGSRHRT